MDKTEIGKLRRLCEQVKQADGHKTPQSGKTEIGKKNWNWKNKTEIGRKTEIGKKQKLAEKLNLEKQTEIDRKTEIGKLQWLWNREKWNLLTETKHQEVEIEPYCPIYPGTYIWIWKISFWSYDR